MNRSEFALVTGVTGTIGSHLAPRLARSGPRVVSFCPPNEDTRPFCRMIKEAGLRLSSAPEDLPGENWDILLLRGDIRHRDFVDSLLLDCREAGAAPSFVVHLAACSTIQQAARDETLARQVNVDGTAILLDAVDRHCRDEGGKSALKGFLYASTDKVYGEGSAVPYQEDHPLGAAYPYEKTKAEADCLVRESCGRRGLPAVVTRFCNVYGPGDRHLDRLVPGTLHSLLIAHRPPLLKMRIDEAGGQSHFYRDMIYVEDLVGGLMQVLRALEEYWEEPARQRDVPLWGEAFNLGTEHCYPVGEIIRILQQCAGNLAPPSLSLIDRGEIHQQCMSFGKANRVFGFRPVTPLETGLERTFQWYRNGGIRADEFL